MKKNVNNKYPKECFAYNCSAIISVRVRVESAVMRQVVLWVTACSFNAIILNHSIFNCLITSASTLVLSNE